MKQAPLIASTVLNPCPFLQVLLQRGGRVSMQWPCHSRRQMHPGKCTQQMFVLINHSSIDAAPTP